MPIFELQTPQGETYEIEAPTMESAAKSFQSQFGNVSQADLFKPENEARARVMNERPDLYDQGERTWLQGVDDRVRATASGAPIVGGWMDEASAGLNTGFGYLGDYDKELAYQRERDRAQMEQQPGETVTGNVAGTVVGTIAGLKGLSRAGARSPLPRSMPKRMVTGAGVGAGLGYEEGFSRGEGGIDDRHDRGQESAKWGAAFGGLAPVVAKPLGYIGNKLFGKADDISPRLDAIVTEKNAAYDAAEKSGIYIRPQRFSQVADDIIQKSLDDSIDPELQPRASRMLDILEAAKSRNLSLSELDNLRKQAVRIAQNGPADEAHFASKVIDGIDRFEDKMSLRDIQPWYNMRPEEAAALLKKGRVLAKRARKVELFENIFENAQNKVGANYNRADVVTAIRQQLAAVAKDGFKHHRYFNAEERSAILQVVRGGKVENFMRWLGRYSAKSPTGIVASAATAGGAGYLIGGPPGAAIGTTLGLGITTAGTAARPIATRMGERSFRTADEMMRFGRPRPPNPLRQLADDTAAMGLLSQSGRAGDYVSQNARLGPR
jgi:hypothetical protein